MPKIVARIQAHPSRADLWPSLIESLAPLPVEVSEHSSDPPNPWAGYQRALRSGLETTATHVLVIQEDAIVSRNFSRALLLIANAKPDHPVSLFLSWLPPAVAKDAREAMIRRERYLRHRPAKFCSVVAVLWPVDAARRFLEWTSSGVKLPGHPGNVRSDDACLGDWIRRQQETVWVTLPSLVEHPDMVASVKGRQNALWGKDRGRCALNFIGDRDPLELDWSG